VGFIRYSNANTVQPDGEFVRGRIGFSSLITKVVNISVLGGYASTIFDSKGNAAKQDFDSFIGQATAQFFFTVPPKGKDPGVFPSSLTIGYVRDFSQSFIGNFYQRDRGYGSLAYSFSGKVVGTLNGGFSRLSYPTTFFQDGTLRANAFVNYSADIGFFIEYRILKQLGINFNGQYNRMFSHENLPASPPLANGTAVPVDALSWEQYVATLGVRYFF
jgi:hypothetical protein